MRVMSEEDVGSCLCYSWLSSWHGRLDMLHTPATATHIVTQYRHRWSTVSGRDVGIVLVTAGQSLVC